MHKPKTTIQIKETLKELSFKEKSLSCKLGFHRWDCIYNGLYYVVACEKCCKKHHIHK